MFGYFLNSQSKLTTHLVLVIFHHGAYTFKRCLRARENSLATTARPCRKFLTLHHIVRLTTRQTAQMDMNWLYWNDRPHLRSRGIVHTLNLCYQSAVLQALMHQPPFLRWIYQHDIPRCPVSVDCLKCHMKRLIQHYWGPGATAPLARNHQALQGIAHLSYQNGFVRGQQDCAAAFYDWVIHTLMDDPE